MHVKALTSLKSGSVLNVWDLCLHQVESGFALNVLFNIFKATTVQKCSEMLSTPQQELVLLR